jgi:hypothetical protein
MLAGSKAKLCRAVLQGSKLFMLFSLRMCKLEAAHKLAYFCPKEQADRYKHLTS